MEKIWDPLARRVPSFGRGLRILLVDHETTSLMYIASMLESHSFRVTTIELASVALSMFEERKDEFDLVMAEVKMEDMTSLAFIQQIFLIKNHMPVIFMSFRSGMRVAEQALSDGACFFLQKPVSRDDLREVWQHVYRKRKSSEGQVEEGVALVEGVALTTELEPLRVAVDEKQRCGDRKRSKEGSAGKRECKRKFVFEQAHSHGKGLIEDVGNEKSKKNTVLEERQYLRWTPDLHFKFTAAIGKLGEKKANPKAILELMNVPNLREGQLSSHLQKYKAQLRSILDASGNAPPPLLSSVNISASCGNGQKISPEFLEHQGSVASSQLLPPVSLQASPTAGYAGPSNSVGHQWHPNPTNNNNGLEMVGYGKHPGSSQIRDREPFLSDAIMNESGKKGKQALGFQGNTVPFTRLTEEQPLVAGPSTTGSGMPQMANLASSPNQNIVDDPW